MTMTGTVKNGVVVPDQPDALTEGERVEINRREHASSASSPTRGLLEWFRANPMEPEQAADWNRSMAEVLSQREEDVALEEQAERTRSKREPRDE